MTASEVDHQTDERKPRAFRFSIRAVLLLITLLAVWFGYRANIALQEAPAVKLVREHGCSPLYSYHIMGNLPSFAPRMVREAIGEEYFGRVIRLNFADGMPTSDEALSMLDHLPGVTVINTDGSSITDEGLRNLAALSGLTTLRLPNAKLTGEGLQHLSGLSELFMLNLDGNPITDEGIAHLRGLHKLEILRLRGTAVTDEGIAKLSGLTQLKLLNVQKTSVTKAGVENLKQQLPDCQIDHPLGSTR